ncbi:alpha/beta hydrolase-fold protein [Pelagicoccus sp. SDUM812002]|uniref:alpha/beta hydrolase n=1 Tax=Pelagicoccus sp. SDUM812002 TaxID=3041266 RepID=UPI00280D4417|nr:alpha/beta hydrolase-fold protein [Pelagicoccus sp. SDUM812002]MDQ8186028.1 alpha/beta hydrolase-fold protein [Pelagicoccus sp. SDUM812002]
MPYLFFIRLSFVTFLVASLANHLLAEDDSLSTQVGFSEAPGSSLECVFSVDTNPGVSYTLLRSNDLVNWTEVSGDSFESTSSDSVEWERGGIATFFKIRASMLDSIPSQITSIDYPVHVVLPDGYENSQKRFPIIYATDGQWVTGGFSSAVTERKKQLILVTIEQGPGDRRAIDFRLPGAYNYIRFIEEELLPSVESIYRVNTSERTFCGTSYGGLLVGLVFLLDDVENPLFKNYLSFDGSFWSSAATLYSLENERYAASKRKNATLYLTSATGFQNNDRWVTNFQNRIESRGYEGLTVVRRSYPVEHNDVAQPSFDAALEFLY